LIREGAVYQTGSLKAPGPFTQAQIRDLQLAKSAVRSGIEILLETAGRGCDELDAVYLAGGIGQALNADSAITVGLLPRALRDKVIAVGNASLGGAARLLLSPVRASDDMRALLSDTVEINLAEYPRFGDLYMKNMFFEV